MTNDFENLLLRLGFLQNMEQFVDFGIDEKTIWFLSERQMEKIFDGNIGMSIKLKHALERERPIEHVDPTIKMITKELSKSLSSSVVEAIENALEKSNIETRSDKFCMDFFSCNSNNELQQTASAPNVLKINKEVS